MGVGIIFLNENNELLIVKPSYKDHWSIPGGVVDEDESPRYACVREVQEEIGLNIESPRLLCVDWTSSTPEKGESLQFVFFGGILQKEQIDKIRLQADEIGAYQFLPLEKALLTLSDKLKHRISRCFEAMNYNTALCLEDAS
jgi:ADP-ribose pyrophosphatase YjhB (NUDIX family)